MPLRPRERPPCAGRRPTGNAAFPGAGRNSKACLVECAAGDAGGQMSMKIEPYILEKWVWSDEDFGLMNWHDVTVHAVGVALSQWQLFLDIDYILRWVKPAPPETQFRFWVAPATLVFENVSDLKIDFDVGSYQEITLDGVRRNNPRAPNGVITVWDWSLESHQGSISFSATGFKQYVRAAAVLCEMQSLEFNQRGGMSFSRDVPARDI